MNAIESAIEVERLALVALQLIDAKQISEVALERAFEEALPRALRLVELSRKFLNQKEDERNAYWDTPKGKQERDARWADIKARYGK